MIKYKALIKTVELGSITKAARELGYSQPGISHMLDALEADVGFPLLKRSKDKIVLNENGEKVLNYCYKIVKDYDELENIRNSISYLMEGNVSVGSLNSSMVSFVPKAVSGFLNVYSNIQFKLEEYSYQDLQVKLMNGSVDVAFTSEVNVRGIEFHPLYDEEICLIMPEGHPFERFDKIPAEALRGCDFIMPYPGWDDLANIVFNTLKVKPNVKHFVASDMAAIAMVANRQGVYILSKDQATNLGHDVTIRTFETPVYRTMGYALRKTRQLPPAVKSFISSVKIFAENYNNM